MRLFQSRLKDVLPCQETNTVGYFNIIHYRWKRQNKHFPLRKTYWLFTCKKVMDKLFNFM